MSDTHSKVLADTVVCIPVITLIKNVFLVKNLLYLQVLVKIHLTSYQMCKFC